jgi:pSer/pThr/pTyr-binding forkhead associated (FHA) protein
MLETKLRIRSRRGTEIVTLAGSCTTVGRGDEATLRIDDNGLALLQASINSDGERVWIIDEGAAKGSFVNKKPVPPNGRLLHDGDEITMGYETAIVISIEGASQTRPDESRGLMHSQAVITGLLVCVVVIAVLVGFRLISGLAGDRGQSTERREVPQSEAANAAPRADESRLNVGETKAAIDSNAPPEPAEKSLHVEPAKRKFYLDMNEKERMEFVDREARKITMSISNSNYPEIFDDMVLQKIKGEVDQYARASGLSSIFSRATEYAPLISRCFNQENVPPVVGLYIVWIETNYKNVKSENSAHAMGLFQFIPETARSYGITNPADRTDVQKMAPAAARYMRDRIAFFEGGTRGVALAIANYNRGGTPKDLRKTIDKENPDRSFWTLMANQEKLDRYFKSENVHYVPRFFAAAIVGENPLSFGISMKPLSTLN